MVLNVELDTSFDNMCGRKEVRDEGGEASRTKFCITNDPTSWRILRVRYAIVCVCTMLKIYYEENGPLMRKGVGWRGGNARDCFFSNLDAYDSLQENAGWYVE
jgi:hypothetical protein